MVHLASLAANSSHAWKQKGGQVVIVLCNTWFSQSYFNSQESATSRNMSRMGEQINNHAFAVIHSLFALTAYHSFLGGIRSLFAPVRGG
jgi:hypothetical protein